MTVSTFVQTDATTQPVNTYNANIDADFSVVKRDGAAFSPHEQPTPDMTVAIDAGHIFNGTVLTEVATHTTATFTAPITDPRIDRVVVDQLTGAVSVITGTESPSPIPPAITYGQLPVAQVLLTPATTALTNAIIIDERALNNLGNAASTGSLLNVQTFTTSGTYTPTPGTNSVIVEIVGGGGSGGGIAATSGSQASVSSGGGGGAYAKGRFTTGFSGATVTVGAGGTAPTAGANNGNAGGSSSFAALMSAPGGSGGQDGVAAAIPITVGGSAASALSTGGNIINSTSSSSSPGLALGLNGAVLGGKGGETPFGGGGNGRSSNAGNNAVSFGTGGGGSSNINSQAARSAGTGASGIVIVYEYA